eukprot:gene18474-22021_t
MIYGFIVLFIGAALLYWIGRRRFNRRNKYGVSQYHSYEHKTVLAVWENIVKLAGQILVLAGLAEQPLKSLWEFVSTNDKSGVRPLLFAFKGILREVCRPPGSGAAVLPRLCSCYRAGQNGSGLVDGIV